jgi:hypothetical protein
VDQFQAQTNGQKAMYSGQGMQNFVLKSGTDQFHGSLFEYFRNNALNANDFFRNKAGQGKGVLKQNQFVFWAWRRKKAITPLPGVIAPKRVEFHDLVGQLVGRHSNKRRGAARFEMSSNHS